MMVKSIIVVEAKHPEPISILGDWILMEYKLLQLEKQSSPRLFTEDGMLMEVSLEQPEKHLSPKLFTGYFFPFHVMLAGITIFDWL